LLYYFEDFDLCDFEFSSFLNAVYNNDQVTQD